MTFNFMTHFFETKKKQTREKLNKLMITTRKMILNVQDTEITWQCRLKWEERKNCKLKEEMVEKKRINKSYEF